MKKKKPSRRLTKKSTAGFPNHPIRNPKTSRPILVAGCECDSCKNIIWLCQR